MKNPINKSMNVENLSWLHRMFSKEHTVDEAISWACIITECEKSDREYVKLIWIPLTLKSLLLK